MKKGDIVNIYIDPITCTELDGKAELLDGPTEVYEYLEEWRIRFIEDNFITLRTIHKTRGQDK